MENLKKKFIAVHKTKDHPMGHITIHGEFDEELFVWLSLAHESVISVYNSDTGQHVMTFGGIL